MNKLKLWIWSGFALVGTVGLAAQEAASEVAKPAVQASDDSIRDVAELDQLPVPTKQVPPQYPAELHAAGVEGRAVLSFVVTAGGDVRDVRIIRSTHEAFGKAAVHAVEQWAFEPGRLQGRAVNTRMEIPIAFELAKEDAAPKR